LSFTGDLLELRQSLVRVGHLDGSHSERARRLEIDPEVIEEHHLLGLHADRRTGEFIEPPIGFADPQDP
jgi:hypothetical protein